MTGYLEDHGLPLVQLKEQRRDLVVALMGPAAAAELTLLSRETFARASVAVGCEH
jgi:hypothetical protein